MFGEVHGNDKWDLDFFLLFLLGHEPSDFPQDAGLSILIRVVHNQFFQDRGVEIVCVDLYSVQIDLSFMQIGHDHQLFRLKIIVI